MTPSDRRMYAAVTATDDLLFISGQVGVADGVAKGDFAGQMEQVYANLGTVLKDWGRGFGDVLKYTTFVVGTEYLPAFYEVRKRLYADIYPDENYPGNTLLAVSGLASPELLIEIEAIARR